MKALLVIFAILSFVAGFFVFGGAKSAIHEIIGLILFLISAIFTTGACIIEAINAATKKLLEQGRNFVFEKE